MKLTFHGAARSVTGSRHLIEIGDYRVLLDCGLVQGRRSETEERNRNFPFDPAKLDAVVLSHAHIDHSGAIPALVKSGFRGTVFATSATADLAESMLRDSAFLQEKDVEWVNKIHRRRKSKQGKKFIPKEPLYTMEDAEKALELFEGKSYYETFQVVPGFECTFHDAGHILGSASVEIELEENGQKRSILFSGDLGRPHLPIVRDPDPVPAHDIVIMETSYGGREHAPNETVGERLGEIMNRICLRRGKLVIPAFSVGRTQEIVFELAKLVRAGKTPGCPIYVDSPLATKITDVFKRHPEAYDEETCKVLQEEGDPFGFKLIRYTRSVKESKALNETPGPFTVISASGMMEGGRVLHHLRNSIGNPDNAILVVGYQAQNTLGRKIVRGDKEVNIFGEPFPVRAEVIVMNEFSAHADRSELWDWFDANPGSPREVFLVHGEEEQSLSFAELLRERTTSTVHVPHLGESFALGGAHPRAQSK